MFPLRSNHQKLVGGTLASGLDFVKPKILDQQGHGLSYENLAAHTQYMLLAQCFDKKFV